MARRRAQSVLDGANAGRGLSDPAPLPALLRRVRSVDLPRPAVDARIRPQRLLRLSRRGDAPRCAEHTVIRLLPVERRSDHLRQDRTVVEHARTPDRLAGSATGAVAVLRALALRSSRARGLLHCPRRRGRARPHVVLRTDVRQRRHLRLRRAQPDERARKRHAASSIETASAAFRRAARPGRRSKRRLVVERRADGTFPVEVEIQFEDGSSRRERWDGRDRWKLFRVDGPSKARAATVDPGRILLLDLNPTNNSFTLHPENDRAGTKWSMTWMVWLQDVLMTYSFFI